MKRTPLNRGDKPLQRKTPLQGREPLKRSSQLERNSGLKPRSDKTAKVYKEERVPFVQWMLEQFPQCQAKLKDCTGKSQDVHEVVSRARGGDIVPEVDDDGNYVLDGQYKALCRSCHTWITDHPVAAEVMGLSRHSWDRDEEAS